MIFIIASLYYHAATSHSEQPMDLEAVRGVANTAPEVASDDEDELVERFDGLGVT